MYHVYILQSSTTGRYYIGMTQRLYTRLNEHNRGKSAFAKAHRPFEIIYTESYTTASDAYQREQEIKSYKGGILFKRLIRESF